MKLIEVQKAAAADLPDNVVGNVDYLVPTLVADWGALVQLDADAAEFDNEAQITQFRVDAYRQMADTAALLLALYGIESASGDAITTVTSRISSQMDARLQLSSRVDRLYRAYRLGELDHVRYEAELLWVALEYRAEAVTEHSFKEVLAS